MTDIYTIRTDDKRRAIPRSGALVIGGEELRARFDVRFWPESFGFGLHADPIGTRIGVHAWLGVVSLAARLESKTLRGVPEGQVSASLDWSADELWAHWSPAVGGNTCVDLLQLAFGEQKHERVIRETVVTDLLLPERPYPCTVTLLDVVRWRERAPVLTREVMHSAEVRFLRPPPFPGKGESQSDLGEDYIAEMFQPGVRSVSESIAEAYRRVMGLREERAGRTWSPEVKARQEVPGRITEHVVMPTDWTRVESMARFLGTNIGALRLYRAVSGHTTVGAVLVIRLPKMPAFDVLQYTVTSTLRALLAEHTGASADGMRIAVLAGKSLFEMTKDGLAANQLTPFDLSTWPGTIAPFLP